MNETDIRKYAQLMKELDLTGLEITEDNRVVRLERTAPAVIRETAAVSSVSSAPVQAAAPAPTVKEDTDYISVKSPLVGVFYTAPAENADPYVSVGDHVKKGQILCLVEAMKLMNEVTAEEDGVIAEICATNGSVVEFGTELFRIKR